MDDVRLEHPALPARWHDRGKCSGHRHGHAHGHLTKLRDRSWLSSPGGVADRAFLFQVLPADAVIENTFNRGGIRIYAPEGKPRRLNAKNAPPNLTMQTSLHFATNRTGIVPGNDTGLANLSTTDSFPPHNPLAPGVDGCLGPVHEMQFAQDVADVTLDGLLA